MRGGGISASGSVMRPVLCAIAAIILHFPCAAAAEIIHARAFEYCGAGDETPPSSADTCAATKIDAIDPQGRDIWIRAVIDAPGKLDANGPAGLYIAAKASSEAYLNGVRLGANGTPAAAKDGETPGLMDAVLPIPDGLLQAGENVVAIRISSHHGFLKLRRPVHWVALAPFADPRAERLSVAWPALIALGVLLAGALYFGVVGAIADARRRDPILLSLLSLFAAAQLVVELLRSVIAYPYPVHDLRLVAIVVMSAGFGLTLSGLVISRFVSERKLAVFGAVAAFIALPIALASGFDAKAGYAVLAAAIASAAITGRAALRGEKQALMLTAALTLFAASIVIFRGAFLDAVFFFEVAALLLVLFAAQAAALERDRREMALERARSHELAAALERAAGNGRPAAIRINSAGAVNIIQSSDITHCKGAGDYVELHLADGRQVLHNGALAQLENELPPTFLRVHRSFIVNTNFVKTLTRESTGVGALVLSNGAEIPVSRRIMPKVRDALI